MEYGLDHYVEVIDRRKKCKDSFDPAVITQEAGTGYFLVKYDFLEDKDTGYNLEEIVESEQLRPMAPVVDVELCEGDIVDAFYRDGWWKGVLVIHQLLDKKAGVVFFEKTNKHLRFDREDL